MWLSCVKMVKINLWYLFLNKIWYFPDQYCLAFAPIMTDFFRKQKQKWRYTAVSPKPHQGEISVDGKVEHLFWKQRRSESFCLLQSDSVYYMSSDFIVRADWQVTLVYTVIQGNFDSVLETNFYHQWNVTTMKVFQVKRRDSPALNILIQNWMEVMLAWKETVYRKGLNMYAALGSFPLFLLSQSQKLINSSGQAFSLRITSHRLILYQMAVFAWTGSKKIPMIPKALGNVRN